MPDASTVVAKAIRQPNGSIEVTCPHCTSVGVHPTGTRTQRNSTPENDARLNAHGGRIMEVLDAHNLKVKTIRENKATDPRTKRAQLIDNGKATMATLTELRKEQPKDEATRTLAECPWCAEPLNVLVTDAPAPAAPV